MLASNDSKYGKLQRPKKITHINKPKRLGQKHKKKQRVITASDTKGGGINDIGFGTFSAIDDEKRGNFPIVKTTGTQTDEVDPDWALEHYPQIEDIENNSLKIVSVVPRDIQAPYYKNRPINKRRIKIPFITSSSQTEIKFRENYPIFKGTRNEISELPYVRSQDWSNYYQNEFNSLSEELDSEWLSSNLSKTTSDDDTKDDKNNCAEETYNSWKLYVNVLRCLGRWPFQRRLNSEGVLEFGFKKISFEFLTFFLTSSFYTCVLILKISTFYGSNFGSKNAISPDIEINNLEFDKYWPYLFWNLSLGIFTFCWNVRIIFNGVFTVDYMNHFSKSVSRLKYVPTDGIKLGIWWWLISFSIYSIILIILFAYKFEPVYYGSGLTATFIFSNLWIGIRFSRHYPALRIFGLIYHLSLIFNLNTILLHIAIYANFLNNMASKWNIRFAYRFKIIARDKLEFYATTSEKSTISSYAFLSIETLLKENQIIASLSRYISEVFRAIFNVYIVISGTMISIFLFRAAAYILTPDTEEEFVKKRVPGIVGQTGDELYYEDDDFSRTISLILVCCYLSISWFLNSRIIASCGETIMSGFKLVQRYGLIKCKDVSERLMIKSLAFQFGPNNDYYLDFGFKFDKAAIFNMSAYIVLFGFGLLTFSPFNLSKHEITACLPDVNSDNFVCKKIFISRVDLAGKQTLNSFKHEFIQKANTSSNGDIFKPADDDTKGYCSPIFDGIPISKDEKIPNFCDGKGNEIKPYRFKTQKDCLDHDPDLLPDYLPYSKKGDIFHYCGAQNMIAHQPDRLDSCGNRPTIRHKIGTQQDLKMVHVFVKLKGITYQMCCWDYGHSQTALNRCNMKNSDFAKIVCTFGEKGSGTGIIYKYGDPKLDCYRKIKFGFKTPDFNCNGIYNIVGCDEIGVTEPFTDYIAKPLVPGANKYCSTSEDLPYSNINYKRSWIYRCYDNSERNIIPIGDDYRDDCGNLPYFSYTIKVNVPFNDGKGKEVFFCCYDYLKSSEEKYNGDQGANFIKLPKSLSLCNVPYERLAICKNPSKTPKNC